VASSQLSISGIPNEQNRTEMSTSGGDINWKWMEFNMEEFASIKHRFGFGNFSEPHIRPGLSID
jgi:hypothetical protein